MSKQDTHTPRGKRGFTLMEIMVAVAIIALFLAIGIPSYSYIQRRAAITAVVTAVKNVQGAVTDYREQFGALPVTSGPGGGSSTQTSVALSSAEVTNSCQGTLFAVAAQAQNLANALRLDMVLKATNPDWPFFQTNLVDTTATINAQTNPVVYDITTKRFRTSTADRAVTTGDSQVGLPRFVCSRVAVATPDEYNNNYYTNGNVVGGATAALPVGSKVVELVMEGCNQKLLDDLVHRFNPEIPVTTLTTTQGHTVGMVKATHLDASSLCTIRIFVMIAS